MTANTGIPFPDTLPLSAPPWLFWSLLLLTFFLHLLPMNFVLGGSLLGAISWLRSRGQETGHHREISRWLGRSMPVVFAAAVTFGIAPLLFVQVLYGRLLYTSSILMGWFWITLIAVLVAAYYGVYGISFKTRMRGPLLVAVPLLVLTVAFMFSNNMSLMIRPDLFGGRYLDSRAGTWLNLGDATLIPRYLHMVLGSVAVTGIVLAIWGSIRRRRDPQLGQAVYRYGLQAFAIVTAVNFVLGTIFLLSYPKDVLLAFMKSGFYGPLSLTVGFVGGLVAIPLAILAAQATKPSRWFPWVIGSLTVTLVAMIMTRDSLRSVILESQLESVSWVAPQWVAIGLFFVLLVVALATVAGMVRMLAGSGEQL